MKILSIASFVFMIAACSNNNRSVITSDAAVAQLQGVPDARQMLPKPAGKVKTIPKNHDGGWYFVGDQKHGIQPGDIIEMEGDYSYINLDSVIGTPEKPVVFRPKGVVRVGVNNSYAWIITHSKYFIIDGAIASEKYGFKIGGPEKGKFIGQSFSFATSDNFEINNVELLNAQVGFFGAPKTGLSENIKIYSNYIHDLDNPSESGRSEGVYMGRTSTASRSEGGAFKNVYIYNNIFKNLAGDGIQVALTENVHIYNNIIDKYGQANLEQQRSGIIIGGCTSGLVANNSVSNGKGAAFQCFGGGDVFYKNNTASNVATSANEDGFYIAGICKDGPLRVHLINNQIKNKVARDFVRDASQSVVEDRGNKF